MQIARIKISNFRGIKSASILLPKYGVVIGDNNCGKTTLLEALDLTLGPDRLNKQSVIDEHDFFKGRYISQANEIDGVVNNDFNDYKIEIEVTIIDLTHEQKTKFSEFIEFWDNKRKDILGASCLNMVDDVSISEAIRITFQGNYNIDEDDFTGKTYFSRTLIDNDQPVFFTRSQKQLIGFLYLRSIRTGSRALSMERGSLLDIIMRIKEIRPRMWEDVIGTISNIQVAANPELGISPILDSINNSLKRYVPKEWGFNPQLKISTLTRENLRKFITAFLVTGNDDHMAPFYKQGAGTINILVLALLSQIAQEKQNVIFAMEEPETAIPPYAQKRIVQEVIKFSDQAIFTSHSPYVVEEFSSDATVVLSNDENIVSRKEINLDAGVKSKWYKQNFRIRICEGLLSRKVLITEGITEATAFPVACRRLEELNNNLYSSLESLGISVIDAGGETNIPNLTFLYKSLGKQVFAICDKQKSSRNEDKIKENVDLLLMHCENGFEKLIINNVSKNIINRIIAVFNIPEDIKRKYNEPSHQLLEFFKREKGNWGIADFISNLLSEDEFPQWLKDAAIQIRARCLAVQCDVPKIKDSTHGVE